MTVQIPADDFGQIRVFAHTGPLPDALSAKSAAGLLSAFGVAGMNIDYIDIVDTGALAGMRLSDYLAQGYDIAPDGMDRPMLDTLTGQVILMMSRATAGRAVSLTLAPGLRHVTTLSDPRTLTVPKPLESDAAIGSFDGTPGRKPTSDGAMSGRIAMIALVVLMALVGLMVWIAG